MSTYSFSSIFSSPFCSVRSSMLEIKSALSFRIFMYLNIMSEQSAIVTIQHWTLPQHHNNPLRALLSYSFMCFSSAAQVRIVEGGTWWLQSLESCRSFLFQILRVTHDTGTHVPHILHAKLERIAANHALHHRSSPCHRAFCVDFHPVTKFRKHAFHMK